MKPVNNAKNGKQPENFGNAQFTETGIPGENSDSQGEKGQAIDQVQQEIKSRSGITSLKLSCVMLLKWTP